MQQANTITTTQAAVQKPAALQRLERARARVKSALHAAEDGALSPAAFDDIARPLVLALRDLEELTINVAVMSRKEVRA